jgi:hypothetical protein
MFYNWTYFNVTITELFASVLRVKNRSKCLKNNEFFLKLEISSASGSVGCWANLAHRRKQTHWFIERQCDVGSTSNKITEKRGAEVHQFMIHHRGRIRQEASASTRAAQRS